MASTVAESAMSSRERVKAAISGKPVDRVPVMYWLNPHMATRLMCEYRSPSPAIQRYAARYIWNRFTRRGEQDSDEASRALPFFLYEYGNSEYPLRLGADIALLSAGAWTEGKRIKRMIYRENGGLRFLDPFGNTRALGGVYAEIIDWPIKSIADLAPYRLPNLSDTSKIESFREKHPDVFILAQVPGPQQLIADGLMSMERFMYALYDHPEEMQLFFRRVGDWCVDIARTSIEAGADAVFIEDDYG